MSERQLDTLSPAPTGEAARLVGRVEHDEYDARDGAWLQYAISSTSSHGAAPTRLGECPRGLARPHDAQRGPSRPRRATVDTMREVEQQDPPHSQP